MGHALSCILGSSLSFKQNQQQCQVSPSPVPFQSNYFTADDEKDFQLLKLGADDISRLVTIFETFSPTADDGFTISINNFYNCLNLEKNILTTRVYDLSDLSGDHKLSFVNFLTMTETDMQPFSFEVYNYSQSGQLQSLELHKSIGLVHGQHSKEQADLRKLCEEEAESLMDIIDSLPDKQMDIDMYLKHIMNYRKLLLPIIQLQHQMRDYVFGEQYWKLYAQLAKSIKENADVQMIFSTARANMNAGHMTSRGLTVEKEMQLLETKYAESMHSLHESYTSDDHSEKDKSNVQRGSRSRSHSRNHSRQNSSQNL